MGVAAAGRGRAGQTAQAEPGGGIEDDQQTLDHLARRVAWRQLDLADSLLIVEAVLNVPAADLAHTGRRDIAGSALHTPAATFGGVGFLARIGGTWTRPPDDPERDDTVAMIDLIDLIDLIEGVAPGRWPGATRALQTSQAASLPAMSLKY